MIRTQFNEEKSRCLLSHRLDRYPVRHEVASACQIEVARCTLAAGVFADVQAPTMASIRTTSHNYPVAEVTAMRVFYRGKRCVITLNPNTAVWAHTMDAALDSSETQVHPPLFLSLCSYQRHLTSYDGCWSEPTPRSLSTARWRSSGECLSM